MMARMPEPSACLNCDQPFGSPRPRYCPACGQETNVKPPTLREFAQQFGGSYIAVEGALWRTLRLLLLQPGRITLEYLAGRRRRYVLPLRLYLTISVVVLLAMRALTSVQFGLHEGELVQDLPRSVVVNLGIGEAGLRDGVFFCDGAPQWVCRRLQQRLDVDARGLQREVHALGERFMSSLGGAMFVLLPSFALWLRLVYANRGLRYTEHLVFALHVHAFWFLMLGLMLLGWDVLTFCALLAVPAYTLRAMRRVYGGRWWPRLLRAAVVGTAYGLTLAAALAGLGLWALLA